MVSNYGNANFVIKLGVLKPIWSDMLKFTQEIDLSHADFVTWGSVFLATGIGMRSKPVK